MSRFFGDPWPSGVCDAGKQVAPPVGERCIDCGEPIVEGEQGWFYANGPVTHKECGFRVVSGGIGHHVNHAMYCRSDLGTDAGLTRRQSALLVWRHVVEGGLVTETELEELRRANEQGVFGG